MPNEKNIGTSIANGAASSLASPSLSAASFTDSTDPDRTQTANPPSGDATTPGNPSLPSNIGPYRIISQLGEGGMGVVYQAEQHHPIRRNVAIKLVRAELGSSNVIARFEAERQALARMDHPHVAKVLDAGTDNYGRPYFVMDLVPGVPITRFCDENRLSIPDRLKLFLQVCDAISHAHTKAILHRDIKATNVLAYDADGVPSVKVIDFGIAKALTEDRLSDRLATTQEGQPIGTYESMSPEQADGSPDLDTRTDVYALGVLLYELLCGQKPFADYMKPGLSENDIRQLIRELTPPRPSDRLQNILRGRNKSCTIKMIRLAP